MVNAKSILMELGNVGVTTAGMEVTAVWHLSKTAMMTETTTKASLIKFVLAMNLFKNFK